MRTNYLNIYEVQGIEKRKNSFCFIYNILVTKFLIQLYNGYYKYFNCVIFYAHVDVFRFELEHTHRFLDKLSSMNNAASFMSTARKKTIWYADEQYHQNYGLYIHYN